MLAEDDSDLTNYARGLVAYEPVPFLKKCKRFLCNLFFSISFLIVADQVKVFHFV